MTNTGFYVRVQSIERPISKMPPLTNTHPLVADSWFCMACGIEFVAGDIPTLIPLGPGSDPEARDRAAVAGRIYNAVGLPIHWECAGAPES